MNKAEYEAGLAALRARHLAAIDKLVAADERIALAYDGYADRYIAALNATVLPPTGPFAVAGLALE